MSENTETEVQVVAADEAVVLAAPVAAPAEAIVAPRAPRTGGPGGRGGDRDRRGSRPPRRGGPRDERRSEFAQKMIGIRRVARVMAGGRRFNFSAALLLGGKKGRVGVGLGETPATAPAPHEAPP